MAQTNDRIHINHNYFRSILHILKHKMKIWSVFFVSRLSVLVCTLNDRCLHMLVEKHILLLHSSYYICYQLHELTFQQPNNNFQRGHKNHCNTAPNWLYTCTYKNAYIRSRAKFVTWSHFVFKTRQIIGYKFIAHLTYSLNWWAINHMVLDA